MQYRVENEAWNNKSYKQGELHVSYFFFLHDWQKALE